MALMVFCVFLLLGAVMAVPLPPMIPGQHHSNITYYSQQFFNGVPGKVWSDVIGNRWRLDTQISSDTISTQLQDIGKTGDGFAYFFFTQNNTVITCNQVQIWGPVTVDEYYWMPEAQYNGTQIINGKEAVQWWELADVLNEAWVPSETNTPVRFRTQWKGAYNQYDYLDFWEESPDDSVFTPPDSSICVHQPMRVTVKELASLRQEFMAKAFNF